MDRLSIVNTFFTGPVITGLVLVPVLSFGFYEWWAIALAVAAGILLSWPAGYVISRRIKRDDPDWNHRRVEEAPAVPKPNAPEV